MTSHNLFVAESTGGRENKVHQFYQFKHQHYPLCNRTGSSYNKAKIFRLVISNCNFFC